jgi:hypothetical protein
LSGVGLSGACGADAIAPSGEGADATGVAGDGGCAAGVVDDGGCAAATAAKARNAARINALVVVDVRFKLGLR